ncbi:MAG: hypothetical protein GY863_12735 [bacterium]|nr:hypothetical protein [bacterium]
MVDSLINTIVICTTFIRLWDMRGKQGKELIKGIDFRVSGEILFFFIDGDCP